MQEDAPLLCVQLSGQKGAVQVLRMAGHNGSSTLHPKRNLKTHSLSGQANLSHTFRHESVSLDKIYRLLFQSLHQTSIEGLFSRCLIEALPSELTSTGHGFEF